MRRLAIIVGSVGCAVFLSACPPPKVYPACDNDQQCQTEGRAEVCVQGQCVECSTDAQCKEGFTCQANKCVPPTECGPDRACPEGQQCTPDGKCVQCVADADCPDKGLCRENVCVARPEGYCTENADCGSGQQCEANQCVAAKCAVEPIRFGFNESSLASLDSASRQSLDAAAQCLKGGTGKVVLEGHADDRGTDEYNLQLSERRAASVKRYLTELGVPSNRLDTVGFGENRPAQEGTSEDAYAANRRVEFNQQ
ncbi:MAG: OmpA family protein [Myxococcaceae bacterium]|nr:OmpA family protein [Myxococcaceae bacterium]MCI0673951.1 OmpA family protein [Myxococcaceae bacterium]